MNNHIDVLENDLKESTSFFLRLNIRVKEFAHNLITLVWNIYIPMKVKSLWGKEVTPKFNIFLRDEGGMFKNRVYRKCNFLKSVHDSKVLVVGAGYGHNVFQLARLKPSCIVCLDLYEYSKEWEFVIERSKEIFGVDVVFIKGDIPDIVSKYENYFDWIISDAVLEHVRDLKSFMNASRKLIKKNGFFYASFGPIWYGPGGDHMNWGVKGIFNHLLLPREDYDSKFNSITQASQEDSCEGVFMKKNKLFSYLSIHEYFNFFESESFEKLLSYAKISTKAITILKHDKILKEALDLKDIPKFDRFCSGVYIWAKVKK